MGFERGTTVEINAKYFKSFMEDLKHNVSNLSPPFKEYGRYINQLTAKQFQTETDPDGRPWQPLKASTILRKKTNLKLRETYKMYKSFFVDIDKKTMRYGLKDDKYKYHHYGSRYMPARIVIGDNNQRREFLNKAIVKHIRTKRAGKK